MTEGETIGRNRPELYLDYAATAPTRSEVWDAMTRSIGEADFNPASSHSSGRAAARWLEESRETIAEALGCSRRDVVFTSGGTQSDNLAILGFARRHPGARILISAVEHPAVHAAAGVAGAEGAQVAEIPVLSCGTVDLDALDSLLADAGDRPTLVSIMWANNEVGTVQPVSEACSVAHRYGAVFHTDAVQAIGKVPVSLQDTPADLLTATAHKIGGPVGIGLLAIRDTVDLDSLLFGGSQERGLWPGTQNAVSAVGFAEAVRLATDELQGHALEWTVMRDRLQESLVAMAPDIVVHACSAESRLPNVLSVGIPGCDAAALLVSLDLEGLAISGGAACSSGAHGGSRVLRSMGVDAEHPYGVVRFSFGPSTTQAAIVEASTIVARVLSRLLPGVSA